MWNQLDLDLGTRPKQVAGELFARLRPALAPATLWFVRKPPGLRVRTRGTDVLAPIIAGLREDGIIVAARESVYEPELRRFGGPRAMELVHAFFHVDSHSFITWHVHRADARVTPAVVSLAMVTALFAHLLAGAGSEIWDAWANLASLNGVDHRNLAATPLPPPSIAQLQAIAAEHESEVLAHFDRGCAALAAGTEALRRDGDFHVGLRAFAADVALFHWNRWGMTHDERVALCEGALAALHPHRSLPCP